MTTIEQLEADIKSAMKEKNESVLTALRLVRSNIKNKQIDLGHELSNDEAVAVLRSMVKQYKDALSDFENAGRTDLAEKQKGEIQLLERYLPASMSDADIEAAVKRAIDATGATGKKDMGKAMGAAMKEIAGRADGNSVRAVLERLLP